jgi:putative ABC transport system substrate-binding protein
VRRTIDLVTDRRGFLATLAGVLVAAPTAAAQPAHRTYRLGWLSSSAQRSETYIVAFFERLRELGFVEGRNLALDYLNANGRMDRMPSLAAEVVRWKPDVVLAPGEEATLAAIERASVTVPIVVVANDYDPVATGHITDFAHPGGRITGVTQLQTELPAKRLQLLKELLPKAKRIAVLSDTATAGQLVAVQAAAARLPITLHVLELKDPPYDYQAAFADAARARVDALLALASGRFVPARRLIPELALKHRLPSMFGNYLWAAAGGLLSYGPNFSELYRRAAEQVGMIFRGTEAGDIPVEQASKFELVINAKTARALGIAIPDSIRLRADRIID